MWWRTLGVAVLLLCVGVAGGYAVADRDQRSPASSDRLEPVPAVSPAVPTPSEYVVNPDPDLEPLQPALPTTTTELRLTKRGVGVSLLTPTGWLINRLSPDATWIFAPPSNIKNTYNLRVELLVGRRTACDVEEKSRIAALESSESQGNLEDLEVTHDTGVSFQASYITGGYRRITVERFVNHDGGLCLAEVAVTGRVGDLDGMVDLLSQSADSVVELEALPKEEESASADASSTAQP